jgi:predicted alpha/beta hydrolase family esterase
MKPTLVFVPGLRGHVAWHWVTLLAKSTTAARTVPPPQHHRQLSCAGRVAALAATIAPIDGPIIIVAHSAGVHTVAHWTQTNTRPIAGALLATPPNMERALPPGYPTQPELRAGGWLALPRWRLPFPAIVASSSNDPLAEEDWVGRIAFDWGAQLRRLGRVGRLDRESGFGRWPEAEHIIAELASQTVA